ncbi:MAG: hypothetical protein BGP04_26610 [Rhizobiales bacterium 62-17]|nr:MarR family transcriptional regulator [Hyphomicrobiales bacterium]OJY01049.1 MAG: hypothetical protein BGP04_26610 [Rhizobiales bacterium 62-17]
MDSKTMRPLYDLPGHLVRRLVQLTQGIYESEAKSFGVTHAQFAILQTVHLAPGLEQREIAEAAGYDSVTASHMIRKLEAMNLLRRDKGSRSRRGNSLHLTTAGAEKLKEMEPAIARVQERLVERLPPEKRKLFLQLLSEITGIENVHRNPDAQK